MLTERVEFTSVRHCRFSYLISTLQRSRRPGPVSATIRLETLKIWRDPSSSGLDVTGLDMLLEKRVPVLLPFIGPFICPIAPPP
jgi:hypothetical protein